MKRLALTSILLPLLLTGGQPPTSPQAPSAKTPAPSGAELYKTHCATCHGGDGKGNGKLAGDMAMNPGDLTQLSVRNGGEFPSFRLRKMLGGEEAVRGHGTKKMPVWGAGLDMGQPGSKQSSERVDRVIDHLKAMQARPTQGRK